MSLSWLQNLEADLKGWVTNIEGVLGTAGKQEAVIVSNAISNVVPTLASAEVANLVNGTPSQSAAVAAKILTGAAAQVEQQTESVGITALINGVNTTVSSVKSAAASAAAAASQ